MGKSKSRPDPTPYLSGCALLFEGSVNVFTPRAIRTSSSCSGLAITCPVSCSSWELCLTLGKTG